MTVSRTPYFLILSVCALVGLALWAVSGRPNQSNGIGVVPAWVDSDQAATSFQSGPDALAGRDSAAGDATRSAVESDASAIKSPEDSVPVAEVFSVATEEQREYFIANVLSGRHADIEEAWSSYYSDKVGALADSGAVTDQAYQDLYERAQLVDFAKLKYEHQLNIALIDLVRNGGGEPVASPEERASSAGLVTVDVMAPIPESAPWPRPGVGRVRARVRVADYPVVQQYRRDFNSALKEYQALHSRLTR